MDAEVTLTRSHLLIAGTGRAGTSFIVRYLAELGLDTQIGRLGKDAIWDEDANAGLENPPSLNADIDLPYVIKTPWLYQLIDDLLADDRFHADAVIIPVRDLSEAAISRCVNERRALHQSIPWINEFNHVWEEWGHVPGGVTFSLNPIDQGRLLAVGFHHLVQRLIAADIPVIFLAFPRLTEDARYIFDKLRPVLPQNIDARTARMAHQRVADPAKVKVAAEMASRSGRRHPASATIMHYPSGDTIEAIALRRELERLNLQLCQMRDMSAALTAVYRSRSWRLTRPIRVLGSIARAALSWWRARRGQG